MTNTLTRMGRPKKSEPTEQVRIPQSVVRRVRRIAAHLGVDVSDYVSQQLAPALDRDEKKMLKEMAKEKEEEAKE